MEPTQRRLRLLMVDDETEFLDATATALGRRGFAVVQASDGASALARLRDHTFDVAVLDVKMPGIDGVDLFRRIKLSHPRLPVIMLTGHGTVQQAFHTSREGVFEYLAKPCDVDQLAATIRRAVEHLPGPRWESEPPPVPPPLRPAVVAPARAPDEIRLLFVDDETELLAALRPGLERRGVRVTTASDANAALQAIAGDSFDVAIVDIKMPGLDGLGLLDRLKASRPLLEVIMLTGHPSADVAEAAQRRGAFAFLQKPKPLEELVQVIRSAYQRHRSRQEEERDRLVSAIREKYPD